MRKYSEEDLIQIESSDYLKGSKLYRVLQEIRRLYEVEKQYEKLIEQQTEKTSDE